MYACRLRSGVDKQYTSGINCKHSRSNANVKKVSALTTTTTGKLYSAFFINLPDPEHRATEVLLAACERFHVPAMCIRWRFSLF